VLDDDLPEEDHDFRVDLIITPERVIQCESGKRPTGLDWTNLTDEQIASIPVLEQSSRRRRE
jgi:5-formyltetrahydrofolate cyclo-ligase